MHSMLKLPVIQARMGISRSLIYDQQRRGLLPTFVKVGVTAVALPEAEVDAVVRARISGADEAAIKALVVRLHTARKAAAPAEA